MKFVAAAESATAEDEEELVVEASEAPWSLMTVATVEQAAEARLTANDDGQLMVEWPAEPGVLYRVYGATDLESGWDVVHETVGDGGVMWFDVSAPYQFFRVTAEKPSGEE